MKPLLTPEQLAVILGVPVAIIDGLVQAGELSFYAVGPDEAVRFRRSRYRRTWRNASGC